MKIVVDTNIVFSAMLNTNSNIADLLTERETFEFHAPYFILSELSKHQDKLMKILKLESTEEIDELRFLVTQNIHFISEFQIMETSWNTALELVEDIDSDDVVFVALTDHLDAILWTGDKKLQKGLKKKGYKSIITTQELIDLKE